MLQKVGKLNNFVDRYRKDTSGQFAVITAMVGIPLLLVAAAAVDINRAHTRNESVQAAIDTAALAAVIPDNMTNEERYTYAQSVFDKNYFGEQKVSLKVSGDRERIDITADSQVPTLISGMLGVDYVKVREETAAVLTRADVVCVLALDPTGARALEFSGEAVYSSPACSVQVNSTSPFAMVSGTVTPPVAKSFCVSGISEGTYSPLVKHACTPIEDPYAGLTPPEDGFCITPQMVSAYLGLYQAASARYEEIGDNAIMMPGTYCDGLKIKGVNVRFLPGTYIIKDKPLEFSQGSQSFGEDVTFVLKGKASLEIKQDANLTLQAPDKGAYAGLVFYQVPDIPKVGKAPKLPSGKSNIKSGGGMSIIGTAYFPTQEVNISSDKSVASQSPATSFIAYRMHISGKSNMQVRVDHEAGGIPPLLPRSDDGARLVSTKNKPDDKDGVPIEAVGY